MKKDKICLLKNDIIFYAGDFICLLLILSKSMFTKQQST